MVSYPIDNLPTYDSTLYRDARDKMKLVDSVIIPPREAKTFVVPAGHFFRIVSIEGPQVGDLNLWNKNNINVNFFKYNIVEYKQTAKKFVKELSVLDLIFNEGPNSMKIIKKGLNKI